MPATTDFDHGIVAVDTNYVRSQLAAVHLIIEGDNAAIIDTGVNASAPAVVEALAQRGIRPQQVQWVILTHIHLDHAGGAGELMHLFPNATLVVHPRGSAHMVAPAKLIAGTEAVYGVEKTAQMYGTIQPVAAERVTEAEHDAVLQLGDRELRLLHTPGHALHHICIIDSKSGHIFSGDTFGISYRELDQAQRQFMFATTTPVHFDPDALRGSIKLLCSYQPEAIYLTHYSQIHDIPTRARDLLHCIDAHVDIAQAASGSGQPRIDQIKRELARWVKSAAREQGWALQGGDAVDLLTGDIELNAQGLEVWLQRSAGK